MITGPMMLSVMFSAITAMMSVQKAQKGLTVSAVTVASAAEIIGPTTGITCNTPVRMPMRSA